MTPARTPARPILHFSLPVLLLHLFLLLAPSILSATSPVGADAGEAGRGQGEEATGPAQEIHQAMAALPELEGRWKGEGWIRRGPGEPHAFSSEEIVGSRLDGQILLVEGIHRSQDDPSRQVFHAFAVLSYDPEDDTYRFRTHTAEGRGGDFQGRVEDGAFVWGHEGPQRQIRYTLRIEGDTWHEVGEVSSDGETWNQFFEMTVERVE